MSAGPRVPRSRVMLFASIALGGAAFDLITKSLIFAWVGAPPAARKVLIPNLLEFQTSHNQGALWGFGRGLPKGHLLFAGLSIVAVLAIIYWLFVRGAARDRLLTIALALITAGALGNCYDRIRFGHVRDFVHFFVESLNFHFAIFNFADNMLVAGAGLLMLLALRPDPTELPRVEPSDGAATHAPRVEATSDEPAASP